MAVSTISVRKPDYPGLFGGMGFNNLESGTYPLIDSEYMNQYVQKCNRELAPGFARLWGGFANWTKEYLDSYYEYYTRMQAETDTTMYLVPGRANSYETVEERKQWAKDVADGLSYLYHEKGMKHLKYYCMSNELALDTGGAMYHGNDLRPLKEYHEYLFREFQRHRLPVGLLAPDNSSLPSFSHLGWAMQNMANTSAAYTSHIYLGGQFDAEDEGFYKYFTRLMATWARMARDQEKLFILSEYGWGRFTGNPLTADHDFAEGAYPPVVGSTLDYMRYNNGPKEAYAQLTMAELNLACINAGVFATGYWSFVDYPDPEISAWRNTEKGRKLANVLPFMGWGTDIRYNKCGVLRWNNFENPTTEAYWCLNIMTRFLKQNTHVMYHKTEDKLLRLAVVRDRQGRISVCIVNRHPGAQDVCLELNGLADRPMRKYVYDPANVARNRFADMQDHEDVIAVDGDGNAKVTLGGNTVTVLTTDYEDRVPPKAENVRIEAADGEARLVWDAVKEAEHRYYRVFANGEQIASTVAESVPVKDAAAKYEVCSVDKFNNCTVKRR